MLYIIDKCTDPYWNLAAEEYLLKTFSDSIFRLWRNDNSIIVGHYQNTLAEIDLNYVKSNQIKVVRRLTGGGAVFHDLGNINFTFIEQHTPTEDCNSMFRRFTAPILAALQSLGVQAYLEGRNDLMIEGKKFSGNAMCLYKNRVLQHGTLLFSASMANLSQALKSRPEKFKGKAVQSTASRVTNIYDHLAIPVNVNQFQAYLGNFICQRYHGHTRLENRGSTDSIEDKYEITEPIIPYQYTEQDLRAIQELRDNKYALDSWNFGKSPAYQFCNIKRYKGGVIEFYFSVEKGVIQALDIYGDYFFKRPTEEFIEAILGTPHTYEALNEKLSTFHLSEYFNNITQEELLSLFFE